MGGYFILRETLKTAKGYQIAKTVETFTPTGLRPYQLQSFPIAKAAHIQSQNAPYLSPRILLRQSLLIPQIRATREVIMHLLSICVAACLSEKHKTVDISEDYLWITRPMTSDCGKPANC
jgi:hypothetical protein